MAGGLPAAYRAGRRLGRRKRSAGRARTRAPELKQDGERPTFPWTDGIPPTGGALDASILERPVLEVARTLLGCRLASTVGGVRAVGVIVEAEAYAGPSDPASHAATRSGITGRNRAMFGPAGRAYVYRSYGVHWCMNVVTGPVGEAQAVLLRGIEPLEGVAAMTHRRGRAPLGAGPGRLCQALGITGALYGHDLSRPPLQLLRGWDVPDALVGVSGRVGVSTAADWPHRFYVRGSGGVSRAPGRTAPGRRGPSQSE